MAGRGVGKPSRVGDRTPDASEGGPCFFAACAAGVRSVTMPGFGNGTTLRLNGHADQCAQWAS